MPEKLETIGNHLKKTRIERNIARKEAACILNAGEGALYLWEESNRTPQFKYMGAICKFLGYIPFDCTDESLSNQLFVARRIMGLTIAKVSKITGVKRQAILNIETGAVERPRKDTLNILQQFIDEQFTSFALMTG